MVVMEFKTSSGVNVRIHDDAYVNATPEELERRERALGDIILRIYESAAREEASA